MPCRHDSILFTHKKHHLPSLVHSSRGHVISLLLLPPHSVLLRTGCKILCRCRNLARFLCLTTESDIPSSSDHNCSFLHSTDERTCSCTCSWERPAFFKALTWASWYMFSEPNNAKEMQTYVEKDRAWNVRVVPFLHLPPFCGVLLYVPLVLRGHRQHWHWYVESLKWQQIWTSHLLQQSALTWNNRA